MNWRHIHVLERLVVFAVIDHRPGYAGHHRADVNIKGIPQVHICENRRFKIPLGDDAVHDNQDGCS